MPSYSQYLGALVGLRVGDALGAPVETLKAGTYPLITDYRAADERTFWVKKGLQIGDFTDDTSMGLCLAQSLLECSGHNAAHQLALYTCWSEDGLYSCGDKEFGMGDTTRAVLDRFGQYTRGEIPFEQVADRQKPTNGGLMRLAAVPLWTQGNVAATELLCAQTTATTHAQADCVWASQLFGRVMALALTQGKAAAFNRNNWGSLPVAFAQTPVAFPILERGNAFTAITSAQVALAAVERSENFEQAVQTAVNCGGDTDTYGALAGTLGGLIWGVEAIPQKWWRGQKYEAEIVELAGRLWERAKPSFSL